MFARQFKTDAGIPTKPLFNCHLLLISHYEKKEKWGKSGAFCVESPTCILIVPIIQWWTCFKSSITEISFRRQSQFISVNRMFYQIPTKAHIWDWPMTFYNGASYSKSRYTISKTVQVILLTLKKNIVLSQNKKYNKSALKSHHLLCLMADSDGFGHHTMLPNVRGSSEKGSRAQSCLAPSPACSCCWLVRQCKKEQLSVLL